MAKSIFGKLRKLEKKKKLQLVIAVSISVVLLVHCLFMRGLLTNVLLLLQTK